MMAKMGPDVNPLDQNPSPETVVSKKLLGTLETDVMQCMWDTQEATVQEVVKTMNRKRPIAYTTVMTVMGHLVEKGLLTRTSEGKRYLYKVAQTKEEFLRSTSRKMIRAILSDFGDMAIAGFMGEIGNAKPEQLEKLKELLQEAINEDTPSN